MPSKLLLQLLSNASKSATKIWSIDTITAYHKRLSDILTKYPTLKDDPAVSVLTRLLDQQLIKTNFLALPLEFPQILVPSESVSMTNIPPPPFYKEKDDFPSYLATLESYFLIAKTPDDQKVNLLWYLLGATAAKVKNYLAPKDSSTATYTEVKAACNKTFFIDDSKNSYVKFFEVTQERESSTSFALRIKEIAKKGGIVDEKLIVNRCITGLTDHQLQFELFKLEIPSFDTLLQKITFLEEIKKLAYKEQNNTVNKIGQSHQNKKKFGKKNKQRQQNHQKKSQQNQSDQNKPKIRKNQCSYCRKLGHWKKDCYILKRKNNANEVDQQTPPQGEDLSNDLGHLHF